MNAYNVPCIVKMLGVCGKLKNGPSKDIHILTAGICDCYLIWQKDYRYDKIKDLDTERFSEIIQLGLKCNHMYLHKKKTVGDFDIYK